MYRPMLADNKKVTPEQIQAHLDEVGYLIMQPKIDGMRALIDDSAIPRTRSGKEHKNRYLRNFCRQHPSLRGVDGELVSGLVYDPNVFRESMSGIRSEDGSPEFTFYCFDLFQEPICQEDYLARRDSLTERLSHLVPEPSIGSLIAGDDYTCKLVLCPQELVCTLGGVNELEQQYLTDGWEGAMLRRPDLPYKFNRSTNRGGELIKLKRFEDDEAIILGSYPWERNDNEATTDTRGYTVRSSHQDNRVALERLGGFHCALLRDRSVTFDIGVFRGWSHSDRDRLWAERESLPGRILKFAHQGYGGGYDRPRTPVGLGWRSIDDL